LELFGKYPVVTITGPRQAGKTTLARECFAALPYVNLEALDVREFARSDPRQFLGLYPDGAVLDEIQRVPELLSYVQPLVDEVGRPGQYVLTGSHQFELLQGISQSLAGRTALLTLLPLALEELAERGQALRLEELLFRGFLPRLHVSDLPPRQALSDYYATYVERDLRQLVRVKDLQTFDRFVRLCAGRVGQLLNAAALGSDAGVSHTTAREWLSLLEASYVVWLLPPWHSNSGKRLVKSPKLYFHDVGLASHLLGIEAAGQLSTHPLRGALFENLVLSETLKFRVHRGLSRQLHFYRDSTGNEVDLLYPLGGSWLPVEIKSGQTVASDYFRGLAAFERAEGEAPGRLVVYGGEAEQPRTAGRVVPWRQWSAVLREWLP